MMAAILRTPQANVDLTEIWCYIAKDNPTAADRFLDSVDQKCETLVRFPRMGQACDDLAPGLLLFTLDRYVIYYHPIDSGIEIVRVVSGARDVGSLF
jgi:toxin ParE1/3/4